LKKTRLLVGASHSSQVPLPELASPDPRPREFVTRWRSQQ